MASLTVLNFSCIESAHLELKRITVLTGPQGSGKSVLSKLVYFFYKLAADALRMASSSEPMASFHTHIREEFGTWFPTSAWGNGAFTIEFQHGVYQIRLTRFVREGKATPAVRIGLSKELKEFYGAVLKLAKAEAERQPEGAPDDLVPLPYRTADTARRDFRRRFGPNSLPFQTFIPAGRSFFTSIGKAVVAFEHGLDPITWQFGRTYIAMRERPLESLPSRIRKQAKSVIGETMRLLFGGEIVIAKGKEYVKTEDGRQVPFFALSSGQQELLPLWIAIEQRAFATAAQQVYLEEPESHLFPEAQCAVVKVLAGLVSANAGFCLLMTTHSPYVLAKLNNLIFAGELRRRFPEIAEKINAVVPQSAQIPPSSTAAYAIVGKNLKSIIDENGLIDGDYLDAVSGGITREFDALLGIEASHGVG